MTTFPDKPEGRAEVYAAWHGVTIVHRLGFGIDGVVYSTTKKSALKALERQPSYETERDVYLRLQEHGVTKIRGHHVPQLIDFDDYLWVIEMSIVPRPFVLDFAKATLDVPPNFPEEVMREWLTRKAADFGEHWSAARAIMNELAEKYGIYLTDLNPNNIAFP